MKGINPKSTVQIFLGAPGFFLWKSATSLGVKMSDTASQELDSSPKPFHLTRY